MIQIRVNSKAAHKILVDMETKHVKFALSRALNTTAVDAQGVIRTQLPKDFIIRKPFLSNRTQVDYSNKRNLRAVVGFRTGAGGNTDFMINQVVGGTKLPKNKKLAIPVDVKKNKRDLIPAARRPKQLTGGRKNNGGYFIGTVRGVHGIWERPGKKEIKGAKKKGEKAPLKLMYRFNLRATIKKRLDLETTVDKVVATRLVRNFQAEFLQALKTSR